MSHGKTITITQLFDNLKNMGFEVEVGRRLPDAIEHGIAESGIPVVRHEDVGLTPTVTKW